MFGVKLHPGALAALGAGRPLAELADKRVALTDVLDVDPERCLELLHDDVDRLRAAVLQLLRGCHPLPVSGRGAARPPYQ